MKVLAIASLFLAANIAVGATSITVYGYGTDRESAKRDAFKTAIEKVCGSAVLSDREHFNGKTIHNNLLSYSSCRVENYTILETESDRIKIRILLSDNKSSHRLFSQSDKRSRFDNELVRDQVDTWKFEQTNGDELIDEIFRDYPYRAYDLQKVRDPYITTDSYRNVYLMVPYDIRWNNNFITAMNETFSAIRNKNGYGVITVTGKTTRSLFGRNNFYIDDLHRLDHIKSKFMYQNEMRLAIKARDERGNSVINICYNPEYKAGGIFYSIGIKDELTIFGSDRNKGTVKINLTFPADVIYDVYVDVVAARDCKL